MRWEAVKNKFGTNKMKNIPFGAIVMYGYIDKLACGLQQFMASALCFSLSAMNAEFQLWSIVHQLSPHLSTFYQHPLLRIHFYIYLQTQW